MKFSRRILRSSRRILRSPMPNEHPALWACMHLADKICLALPKLLKKNCLHQIFSLVIMGTLKNSKICVDHKVSMTWQDQRSKRDQHEIKFTCLMFPLRLRGVNWKICHFSCLTKICLVLKQDAGTFLVWSGLTNYIGKKNLCTLVPQINWLFR